MLLSKIVTFFHSPSHYLSLNSHSNPLSRYKKHKYNDSEEQMQKYTTIMRAYGISCGIDFDFHGTVANTLTAHRLIRHYQEEKGTETANAIVNSLYSQYFEHQAHPSSAPTLLAAATAANIPSEEAEAFIDEDDGLQEVKMLIREQKSNGIDSVPYIVIEGKRRDFTLEGAKEVAEYVKVLESVIKESS
ncbi:MAG: hypothetical protein M1836_006897 [Candelina mexicana]|nr:MAG: hypothetical protein M1836_006897 [Candelina mexicana]